MKKRNNTKTPERQKAVYKHDRFKNWNDSNCANHNKPKRNTFANIFHYYCLLFSRNWHVTYFNVPWGASAVRCARQLFHLLNCPSHSRLASFEYLWDHSSCSMSLKIIEFVFIVADNERRKKEKHKNSRRSALKSKQKRRLVHASLRIRRSLHFWRHAIVVCRQRMYVPIVFFS